MLQRRDPNLSPVICVKLDLSNWDWSPADHTVPAFTRVRWLNMSTCKLKTVPEVLRSCASLTKLELQDNPISIIPDWLSPTGKVLALKYLDVSSTHITTLSLLLSMLQTLRAFDCPHLATHYKQQADSIEERRGEGKLLQYMQDCTRGGVQQLLRITVTLVGAANVGKSRIVECMTSSAPRFYESHSLQELRKRTAFPVMHPHVYLPSDAASSLHVMFTDPPGNVMQDLCCADQRMFDLL